MLETLEVLADGDGGDAEAFDEISYDDPATGLQLGEDHLGTAVFVDRRHGPSPPPASLLAHFLLPQC